MTNSPAGDQHPPSGATPPKDGITSFFNWFRSTGLQRSDSRWIGGVAGGIAARLGIDPIIVRGIFIVVAVLGGPALFLYAAAWALVPDTAGRIYLERAIRGIFDPAIVAIGILVLFTVVPFMRGLWWAGAPGWWNMPAWLQGTLTTGWVLALVAVIVWLIIRFARRDEPGATNQAQSPGAQQPGTQQRDYWTSDANLGTPAPGSGATFVAGAGGAATAADTATQAQTSAFAAEASTLPTAQTTAPTAPTAAFAGATPTTPYGTPAPGFAPQPMHHGARRAGWTSQEFREEVQRQREEQARADRARALQRRHTVPGAGFIAISLGLALVGGAVAAVFITQAGLPHAALVTGIGTALAVVALATVVAGIMGRNSGWLASFAWIGVIALLVVGVVPAGTQMQPFGRSDWHVTSSSPTAPQGFAMIAGAPTVDLSDLDAPGARLGGTIDVWLGAGKLDLVLPDDVPVIVKLQTLAGTMDIEDRAGETERGGVFYRNEARFGRTASPDTVTVQVWMLAGTTHITDDERAGR
ncbi:PspC domain-containing protein [Plantibacter sp. Mn2098]|uniref:PspC domain-containing protein n=1 Tax=Plantibacter sp. Mn2098 TaxID=3395266 RepID=UPI003BE1CD08